MTFKSRYWVLSWIKDFALSSYRLIYAVLESIIRGNRSEVHLLSPSTHKQRYVCLATNNLGVSINATYDQLPAQTGELVLKIAFLL